MKNCNEQGSTGVTRCVLDHSHAPIRLPIRRHQVFAPAQVQIAAQVEHGARGWHKRRVGGEGRGGRTMSDSRSM